MPIEKLPLETQTLYAELIEQLTALEAERSVGHLKGCFVSKTVKGKSYYYFQYSDPGGVLRQVYIGKKDHYLEKLVERFEKETRAIKADIEQIQRLCAQLRAGGALVTETSAARVLKALAEAGLFRLNGVLVGTHAFNVLGNLLGVKWKGAASRTQDIDIAGEAVMQIALPNVQADVPQTLESLKMGFLPVPSLNPKHASTSFKVRGRALRVDIVTPEVKANRQNPIIISRFAVAAQPLRFLDYLIENPIPAAVVDSGGVLVNVPAPARFAFHKLITSRERSAAMHDKVEKDLLQAAQLFSFLAEERPGDLTLAWEALNRRGNGWIKRVTAGLAVMAKRYREAHQKLRAVIPES